MIEDLKDEDLINKIGGRFKLTALIQKRLRELMFGARPMVEPGNLTQIEIAIREIKEGKIGPGDGNAGSDAQAQ